MEFYLYYQLGYIMICDVNTGCGRRGKERNWNFMLINGAGKEANVRIHAAEALRVEEQRRAQEELRLRDGALGKEEITPPSCPETSGEISYFPCDLLFGAGLPSHSWSTASQQCYTIKLTLFVPYGLFYHIFPISKLKVRVFSSCLPLLWQFLRDTTYLKTYLLPDIGFTA